MHDNSTAFQTPVQRQTSTATDNNGEDDDYHAASNQASGSLESIEAEALELLGQRKRRKRVRYSCTECHRRKHKCDRDTPCGKCVERGVATSCTPHDGSAQDTHDRMRQLEAVLSRLVEASRNSSHRTSAHNTPHVPAPVAASNLATNASVISPSNNAAASSRSTPDGRQRGTSTPRRKSNPGITTAASLPFRAQVGSEMLEFSSSTQSYPPSAHFERLVREGSLQQDEIRSLASTLPSQDQTTILLDVFFRDINPLMFPFDEMWFREAVNSAVDVIWGDADVTYGQDGPDHLSVISLLFVVLPLTYLSQPLALGSEADGAAQAARMSFQCRRSHMLASSIHCHDPFIVLSCILLARFLILRRQAKDSWLVLGEAIREAQFLGLHRLGHAPTPDPDREESREAAMKRMIWMHLYFEDRFSSLIVGQVPLIHDSYCDAHPPFSGPWVDTNPQIFDLGTVLRIRNKLSRIVSKVLDIYFSDQHEMVYEEVMQLDSELHWFQQDLPVPYRMDDNLTGFTLTRGRAGRDDGSYRKIVLHRFVLHISICYLLISIHLPYLRRGSDDTGFERSRQVAMQAALDDHRARQELKKCLEWPDDGARDSFVGGRFFYFHATSTLGICLLSEPDVVRVKRQLHLLDEFLEYAKEHQRQQGVDPNRCIRQEIGIVNLIRGRVKKRSLNPDNARVGVQTALPLTAIQDSASSPLQQVSGGGDGASSYMGHIRNTVNRRVAQTPLPYLATLFPHGVSESNQPADVMETRQPEVGEDMYDWWSWLVSNLSPSDIPSSLTPADTTSNTRTDIQ